MGGSSPVPLAGYESVWGFKLKGSDATVTRRAGVMIRAVGETIVVDPLFFLLSVFTGGLDGGLTGFAGVSALFSVLELLTEMQYYAEESAAQLEPASSPANDDARRAPASDDNSGIVRGFLGRASVRSWWQNLSGCCCSSSVVAFCWVPFALLGTDETTGGVEKFEPSATFFVKIPRVRPAMVNVG